MVIFFNDIILTLIKNVGGGGGCEVNKLFKLANPRSEKGSILAP